MDVQAEARKEKLVADLIEARHCIVHAASSLSPKQQDQAFIGIWSVKDLLAHLVGWDMANIQAIQAILSGQLPEFYAHYEPNWQTFNAGLVARYKVDDLATLIAVVQDSHRQLIECLQGVPAVELDRDRGLRFQDYMVTVADTLEVEVSDEWKHCRQVQGFAERRESKP